MPGARMGITGRLAARRLLRDPRDGARPHVAVLEDDPQMAAVVVEVCRVMGLRAAVFRTAAAYQAVFHDSAPRLVILDWRLEREVTAAVFLVMRHRWPGLPIVFWTASTERDLPAMVTSDRRTRVVPKTSGVGALEAAIRGASLLGEAQTEAAS